jgi:cytochrome b involved in lipid metabolism
MKISRAEVGQHNTKESSWIIINNNVYDVTKFSTLHPGGKQILLDMAGKESTKEFEAFHKSSILQKYHDKLFVGEISDHEKIKKKNSKGT